MTAAPAFQTLLYDVAAGQWAAEAIAWAGIDATLLAPVRGSADRAGAITVDGREIEAAVGGADTACALAGLGLGAGDGFVAVGSGSPVCQCPESEASTSGCQA